MEANWTNTSFQLPENGTIVEIKVAKESCRCGGYQTRECYYDDGFSGIRNQKLVDKWRLSPANDMIKQIDLRKSVIAQGCAVCVN